MSVLAEFQRAMLVDVLYGSSQTAGLPEIKGAGLADALAVHRNTVYSALENALELTFPTVAKLAGDNFRALAMSFAASSPPTSAVLTGYGMGFADFIAGIKKPHPFPTWLPDVARFDHALDSASSAAFGTSTLTVSLDGSFSLTLDASLQCLCLEHRARLIRDVLDEGTEDLSRIDPDCKGKFPLAIWRSNTGVHARDISVVAFLFLDGVFNGKGAAEALSRALDAASEDDVTELMRRDVLAAPYAFLTETNQALSNDSEFVK